MTDRTATWYWQVNSAKPQTPSPPSASRSSGGGRPRLVSLGPEAAKGGSADQMRLDVEGVVDSGVGGEKPLG